MDDGARRSAILDGLCIDIDIDSDPATITRSTNIPVAYDKPSETRDGIDQALHAGFHHIVLTLPAPCPANVAHWITEEFITPIT